MADERMQESAGAGHGGTSGAGGSRGAGASSGERGASAPDASPQARPGVPIYARGVRPIGASAQGLPRMGDDPRHLKRQGLPRLTPIYGTANPPHGVAGAMRRMAYRYPENLARHWMMLLVADRVDVVEDRLGGLLEKPFTMAGLDGVGRTVRRNPFTALAVVLGAGYLARRALR